MRICVIWWGFYILSEMVCVGRWDSIKLEFDLNINLEIMDDGEFGGVILIILFFYLMN